MNFAGPTFLVAENAGTYGAERKTTGERANFYKVKKGTEEFQTIKKEILTGTKLPKPQGKYVYTLRLKSKPKYIYVGMTGLHPYERYLNHIIGYKSSLYAKKYA